MRRDSQIFVIQVSEHHQDTEGPRSYREVLLKAYCPHIDDISTTSFEIFNKKTRHVYVRFKTIFLPFNNCSWILVLKEFQLNFPEVALAVTNTRGEISPVKM